LPTEYDGSASRELCAAVDAESGDTPGWRHRVARRYRRLLVAALVVLGLLLVWPAVSAVANTFGPSGCCRYADSSAHTWLDSSEGSGSGAWAWYVTDSFNNDLAPTDMNVQKVTYHYKSTLTWPYVDVSWWTASLPSPNIGEVTCNKVVVGDNTRCDHWHMRLHYPTSSSSTTRRHVACQEITPLVWTTRAQAAVRACTTALSRIRTSVATIVLISTGGTENAAHSRDARSGGAGCCDCLV
jgi:hypothetical protein